ncbi:MAG: gas vesicle protein GvpN [Omnitrophica bacterium RIFCSPLOWO2_12_FULL_50_11]|nr:MAG: gas vesicle protein GvpN [Omnitrophica bacterium RIFCSPLOWO2_12_FULL_50_11]
MPNVFLENEPTVLELEPEPGFVETPQIKNITERAIAYLKAGFPVHFSGPAGTGKTTLALHLARQLGQPCVLLFGDEELGTSDLIGGEFGVRRRKLVDNFIHSVLKTEEDVRSLWVDSRVTSACKNGFTLVYDEFNRSRPEANNVLLSVLEERMLTLPMARQEDDYLQVHPNFKAIFTSNPEEYAGVHKTQDALRDRMVTIDLDFFDRETEIAITKLRGSVSEQEARKIVDVIRALRRSGKCRYTPTIRACIIIAKVTKLRGAKVKAGDKVFREVCMDVLTSQTNQMGEYQERKRKAVPVIQDLIRRYC